MVFLPQPHFRVLSEFDDAEVPPNFTLLPKVAILFILNPFKPGGNKKVTHTQTNLQRSPAGLFKYA